MFAIWGIWRSKNLTIFANDRISIFLISSKFLRACQEFHSIHIEKALRIINFPSILSDVLDELFDGASNLGLSGCGISLIYNARKIYHIWMGCDEVMDTIGELLALWILLKFVFIMGIDSSYILGDSRVIVDWFNGASDLQIAILKHWKFRIQELQPRMQYISCRHIFHQLNSIVDALSKKEIGLNEGVLFYEEYMDGRVLSKCAY